MVVPRFMLAATFAAILIGSTRAENKSPTNQDRIVGIWELTPRDAPGCSTTIEFTKDGKIKALLKTKDSSGSVSESREGTYSIDGNKLVVVAAEKDGETETLTIMNLTGNELVAVLKLKDRAAETLKFKRR